MTISTTTVRNNYTGNGSLSTYSYTFRIVTDADMLVVVRNNSTNVETTLTLTTDYTVTGANESAGGTVVLVSAGQAWLTAGKLTNGFKISLRRKMSLVQNTDIRNQGDFFPETHEDEFDSIVMQNQQQQDEIARSVKLPETIPVASFDPTLPAEIAGSISKILLTNDSGTGLAIGPNISQAGLGDVVGPAASVSSEIALYSGTTGKLLKRATGTGAVSVVSGVAVVGTQSIANGGTGQITKAAAFDALSPMTTGGDLIYGGASGTGTRLANGTTGQYLKSAGSTSAPVWTTFIAPTVQVLTSGTAYATPAGLKYAIVTCVGGGGGGGGGANTSGGAGGGGGGGGGTSKAYFVSAATMGASQTYAIGGAGTGGTSATPGNNGTSGGTTNFGTICSATGGAGGIGGVGVNTTPGAGGAGGIGSLGTVNFGGGGGNAGSFGVVSVVRGDGGAGGSSSMGGGGSSSNGAPSAGQVYGGGGGGGAGQVSAENGAQGIIIVEEYYQ